MREVVSRPQYQAAACTAIVCHSLLRQTEANLLKLKNLPEQSGRDLGRETQSRGRGWLQAKEIFKL